MAFGLDDSDFEDLLESSTSEDEVPPLLLGLPARPSVPILRALTATASREALQNFSSDASRAVPPNRQVIDSL